MHSCGTKEMYVHSSVAKCQEWKAAFIRFSGEEKKVSMVSNQRDSIHPCWKAAKSCVLSVHQQHFVDTEK